MKKIFVSIICMCMFGPVWSAATTVCPAGLYISTMSGNGLEFFNESCPTGYTAVIDEGNYNALSCDYDWSLHGGCWLFAPSWVDFTDESGTYQYTEPCMTME